MSEDCSDKSETCSANNNHVENEFTSDNNTVHVPEGPDKVEGKERQDKKLQAGVAHIKPQ